MLLTIEKLIYGGDGLARLPADASGRGKTAFIPFVLANEKVEAEITQQKASYARAEARSIVEKSPHRVAPGCPYFERCGGCHYQHADYAHQIEIKTEILRESLRRTAKVELTSDIEVHPSPPWNYRNRSRLQVQTEPEFATGYFKMSSHELLPVEVCPISSPLINRGITELWTHGRRGKVPHGVREVEFFANAEDSELLVVIFAAADSRRASLRNWAEEWRTAMPEVAGVVAFRESEGEHGKKSEQLLCVGADHLTYRTEKAAYRVKAGSFFQTNRHLTDELVKVVAAGRSGIRSGELALDLYAGVGLFSTALACDMRHVISVESSQTSSGDLSYNLPANGEAVQAATEQFLSGLGNGAGKNTFRGRDLGKPDLVVVDPPRGGLGDGVAGSLATLGAAEVVYVSCDPATLARDLTHLLNGGYSIERVHLVDLFPQTYHLESVLHLALK